MGEVRGIGMMAAVEVVADKAARTSFSKDARMGNRLAAHVASRGVSLRALGDSLCCAPPLVIEAGEIDLVLDAVEWSLDQLRREVGDLPAPRPEMVEDEAI